MRVAALIPNKFDAISLYRGIGPLSHLRRIVPNLEFVDGREWNWVNLSMVDAVYISRPYLKNELDLILMAKELKVPIWVDYDDNLFQIPHSNPAVIHYDIEAQKRIQEIVAVADVVTVSTDHLNKTIFSLTRNANIYTVPNAWPDHIIPFFEASFPRQNVISWRGSKTHDDDLMQAHQMISMVEKEFVDVNFAFFGEPFWQTVKLLPDTRYKWFRPVEPLKYLKQLFKLSPKIHFVPLRNNEFNQSKSNIAWIEATYAGATVIAPDMPEWRKPGVINYDNSESGICYAMRQALDMNLEAEFRSSKSYIEENLMLSNVNFKRKEILENLCV